MSPENIITGRRGAELRLQAVVKWEPIARWLMTRAMAAPSQARLCMGRAVAWWLAQSLPHIPVRARSKPGQYRRQGSGMTRKSARSFVDAGRNAVKGGIIVDQPHAIYLAAGTRTIAGGRVMTWRQGDPPITMWPAKAAGGAPGGRMPIVLPWHAKARDRLLQELKEAFA